MSDSNKLGTTFVEIVAKTDQLEKDVQSLKKKMEKESEAIGGVFKGKIGSAVKEVGASIAVAFGIRALFEFGKEAVQLASKMQGVKRAFMTLEDAPNLLEKLRQATRNTVTDFDLMKQSMRAQKFGIPLDLLAKGLKFAGDTAIQTGQDVNYLADSFVDGLGRKSLMILDNLDISQIKMREELKKTGGDFEKAVGNVITAKLAEMGNVADSTSVKMAQLKTKGENLKTEFGTYLLSAVDQVTLSLGSMLDKGQSATILMQGLGTGAKIVASVFMGVTAAVQTVGTSLGMVGAALVSLFTGDFKKVGQIFKNGDKMIMDTVTGTATGIKNMFDKNIEASLNASRKLKEHNKEVVEQDAEEMQKAHEQKVSLNDKLYDTLKFASEGYVKYRKDKLDEEVAAFRKAKLNEKAITDYYNAELKKIEDDHVEFDKTNKAKILEAEETVMEAVRFSNEGYYKWRENKIEEQLKQLRESIKDEIVLEQFKAVELAKLNKEKKEYDTTEKEKKKFKALDQSFLKIELDRLHKEFEERKENADKLHQDALSNITELGDLMHNSFQSSGQTFLEKLDQALQIAVKIAETISSMNEASSSGGGGFFGSLLSMATSFLPGGGAISGIIGSLGGLFGGGGKARGGMHFGGSIPHFSSGVNNWQVPTGSYGDRFPVMVESGEKLTVTPSGVSAPTGISTSDVNKIVDAIYTMNKNLVMKDMAPVVSVRANIDSLKFVRDEVNPNQARLKKAGVRS